MRKSGSSLLLLPILLATLFWALGHPLGRILLERVHPFQLGSVTLAIGFLCVFLYLAAARRLPLLARMRGGDIAGSLALGVLGFAAYQVLTFSALARIPASMNAILVSSNVVLIAILSAVFLKERIGWRRVAGILIAFAGVALVTFNRGLPLGAAVPLPLVSEPIAPSGFRLGGSIDLLGCAFSLLAALCFALYTILGKRLVERNDPLLVTALALLAGALLLGAVTSGLVGLSSLGRAGGQAWWLMVLLGVSMIGFAYPAWFETLKKLPASRAPVFVYLTPVFAVILSFLILDERFSWLFYLGGLLVLAGVALSSSRR
jgi:drug/metabolite transporter (DMT)-like permease